MIKGSVRLKHRSLLFPKATSQVAVLARIFGDCYEGEILRSLLQSISLIFKYGLIHFRKIQQLGYGHVKADCKFMERFQFGIFGFAGHDIFNGRLRYAG